MSKPIAEQFDWAWFSAYSACLRRDREALIRAFRYIKKLDGFLPKEGNLPVIEA